MVALSYRGVAHPIDLTEKGATGLGQVLAPERCPDVRRTRPTPLRRPGRWVRDSRSRAAPGGLRYRAGLRPRRKLVGAEDYLLEALGRGQRGRPMMAQPTPPGAAARAHGSRAGVHPGAFGRTVWPIRAIFRGMVRFLGVFPRRTRTMRVALDKPGGAAHRWGPGGSARGEARRGNFGLRPSFVFPRLRRPDRLTAAPSFALGLAGLVVP